jgi:hypothetical protein
VTNPRVQQLHQSGAALGHAVVWDGTTWVAAPAATGMDVVANFDDYFDLATGAYDVEFDRADTTSLPSGWSWVNQGGSDYREVGGLARLYADGTGGSTSANECHRMLVRALPSESTWTAVLKIPSMACYPNTNMRAALVLRDSSGGDYVTWGRRIGASDSLANVSFDYWSALNTLDTGFGAAYMADVQTFLRIKKVSGTSYSFASSADGVAWQTFWSGYDPTANGLTLDQIGILGSCPSGSSNAVGLEWFRVRT